LIRARWFTLSSALRLATMGVVRAVSRRSVDELTQDVGVAGVPGSLDAHVDENLLLPHPPTL